MTAIRKALLLFGFSLSAPALAGAILALEMTEHYDVAPVKSTIAISTEGNSSRMEVATEDGRQSAGMIYRGDRKEMVAIDHEKREYYVLDEASMEQMATQLGGAMQEMQKALESMSPEQRAMAEKMMKQHMPEMQRPAEAPATLEETGKADIVNGFDCDYYEVRRRDRKIRELCVTDWDDLPGGRGVANAMLDMAGFFDRIATTFSEGAGMNVMGEQQEILAHMQELDGYPVLTREFDDSGDLESETILTSATTEDLEPALFSPPAGYSEMNLDP
jgi:hypothetical protein